MSTDGFLATFDRLAAASGWGPTSPSQLVDRWRDLVAQYEGGYGFDITELDDDLSVRDRLDVVLRHPDLQNHPEREALAEAVAVVDDRFRAASRDDVRRGRDTRPWWQRCVPRAPGAALAEDLRQLHGIDTLPPDPA